LRAIGARWSGIEDDSGARRDVRARTRAIGLRCLLVALLAISASVPGPAVGDDAAPDCRTLRLGDPAAAIPVCAAAAERALADTRLDEAEELLF
jgi:hypothetical protein